MQMQSDVVIRLFNPGAGRPDPKTGAEKPLNMGWFTPRAEAIEGMMRSKSVGQVVVVSNCDPSSPYGEGVRDDGSTPTERALIERFGRDNITVLRLDEWGANAGSGRAVQCGVDHLLSVGTAETIMIWSPELALTPSLHTEALSYMGYSGKDIVSILRELYWMYPAQMLPQHTCFIGTLENWRICKIPKKADGDEGRTVQTKMGEVPLAGMDDYCRLIKAASEGHKFKIGMFGRMNPVRWNVDLVHRRGDSKEVTAEKKRQEIKLHRQPLVALAWTQDYFPEQEPIDAMTQFFQRISIP